MTARGDYFPLRVNLRVPNMESSADVRFGGLGKVHLPPPIALNTAGILATTSIAAAGNTGTFAAAYSDSVMGKFGRNVSATCDGAATSTVTITGKDYLGQPMVEVITLAGAATIQGKKAFKQVSNVAWGLTASRNITVGWGDVLGLPYKLLSKNIELRSKAVLTSGTFVVGVDTQTTSSADPRGTYAPASATDGVAYFDLDCMWDDTNLHGAAHVIV